MNPKLEWTLLAVLAATAGGGYLYFANAERAVAPEGEAVTAGLDVDELEVPPAPSLSPRSLSAGLPTEGQWRGNPVLHDLDGDGHLDLVASIRRVDQSTPGEGIFVWRGDGLGDWTPWIDGLRREYVEMYNSAAAIALDETTAQVAKVRKKLKARLAEAEAEIERLRSLDR